MPLPPPRDHTIDRAAAAAMTRRFRESGAPAGRRAVLFHREIVDRILAQTDCAAIRVYDGLDEKRERQVILVGVDKDGNDMTSGVIAELGLPCPPYCGGGTGGDDL